MRFARPQKFRPPAAGDDQPQQVVLAFEDRVGGHRGAVENAADLAAERGTVKLIDRGAYAETPIKKGLIRVSDMDLECMRCADDSVLERYWKDLYKYTVRPIEYLVRPTL
jgi:hypothetical protein